MIVVEAMLLELTLELDDDGTGEIWEEPLEDDEVDCALVVDTEGETCDVLKLLDNDDVDCELVVGTGEVVKEELVEADDEECEVVAET